MLKWDPADLENEEKRVKEWLDSSELPLAVFCAADDRGALLINLITQLGYDVPNDVAVLGTGNWEMMCETPSVHLSSIDNDLFTVGYESARKLDLVMDGTGSTSHQTFIPPKGIVERESTNTIGATSPYVRDAIAIMERDFSQGIGINDIVSDLGISRSTLENAFREDLGYPPVEALQNVRMKVAAQLLASTDHKVLTISNMIGMKYVEYFHAQFKKFYGMTPRKYRLQKRSEG